MVTRVAQFPKEETGSGNSVIWHGVTLAGRYFRIMTFWLWKEQQKQYWQDYIRNRKLPQGAAMKHGAIGLGDLLWLSSLDQ